MYSILIFQDLLDYKKGRVYVKSHMRKGKAKNAQVYRREERNNHRIPESRAQLDKFVRDQNRELKNFIEATDEQGKFTDVNNESDTDFNDIDEHSLIDQEDCRLVDSDLDDVTEEEVLERDEMEYE